MNWADGQQNIYSEASLRLRARPQIEEEISEMTKSEIIFWSEKLNVDPSNLFHLSDEELDQRLADIYDDSIEAIKNELEADRLKGGDAVSGRTAWEILKDAAFEIEMSYGNDPSNATQRSLMASYHGSEPCEDRYCPLNSCAPSTSLANQAGVSGAVNQSNVPSFANSNAGTANISNPASADRSGAIANTTNNQSVANSALNALDTSLNPADISFRPDGNSTLNNTINQSVAKSGVNALDASLNFGGISFRSDGNPAANYSQNEWGGNNSGALNNPHVFPNMAGSHKYTIQHATFVLAPLSKPTANVSQNNTQNSTLNSTLNNTLGDTLNNTQANTLNNTQATNNAGNTSADANNNTVDRIQGGCESYFYHNY